ncbi:MAG: phosphoribosylanthranilate isomerase [Clostridiales bacterium]|nr:phosphoribosylanthranilate isomerase [Clostridiales bacterium]
MKVKICGITSKIEILKLIESGVDYAGFVINFPKSKRNNTLEQAKEIVDYAKESEIYKTSLQSENSSHIKFVAVVVSPALEEIVAIEAAGFDIIQIHGEMNEQILANTTIQIFIAININKDIDVNNSIKNMDSDKIIGIVFDGATPGEGKTFNWSEYLSFDRQGKMFIVAGGLNILNVTEAILTLRPDVVDVSSGVEYDNIGKKGKDLEKIDRFIETVQNVKIDLTK